MSTPTQPTPIPGAQSADPALRAGVAGVLGALALDAATYFSLPVDDLTKLIIGAVITVLAPAVTALIIRARAWAPASVARLQADLLDLVHETQAENPPPIVTNQALNPTQAAEAHPGGLGLTSYGDDEPPETAHGRHERS